MVESVFLGVGEVEALVAWAVLVIGVLPVRIPFGEVGALMLDGIRVMLPDTPERAVVARRFTTDTLGF